jgi:hypothetical protein
MDAERSPDPVSSRERNKISELAFQLPSLLENRSKSMTYVFALLYPEASDGSRVAQQQKDFK